MDELTDAQIEVMLRVRQRLDGMGFEMTEAEMVSYAVIYRRLRREWAESGAAAGTIDRKPSPIEVLVLFGQEEKE